MYPDDRKDTSPGGKEAGFLSRTVFEIEKCCTLYVCVSFVHRELQIAFNESDERLQSMNSRDDRVSLFCHRSWHNPSICKIVHRKNIKLLVKM